MPGSGKDTQASLLSEKLNIPHISTGKIFRQEMEQKTDLGLKIDSIMRTGKFVDDETTIQVIKKQLKEHDDFIFNGFPRNLKQAQWFDDFCKKENIELDAFIFLDISEQLARERIKKRSVEIQRPEDASEESLKNRFDIYYDDTLPGIRYYNDRLTTLRGEHPPHTLHSIINSLIRSKTNGNYV